MPIRTGSDHTGFTVRGRYYYRECVALVRGQNLYQPAIFSDAHGHWFFRIFS